MTMPVLVYGHCRRLTFKLRVFLHSLLTGRFCLQQFLNREYLLARRALGYPPLSYPFPIPEIP